ncbi:unnamed protein product [Ascophyllum nodosum]
MPDPASLADENPIARAYRVWASTCPFLSRSMMLVLVTTFFLSLVLPNLSWALQNSVDLTIHNYEVYRLVTSVFGGHSMLGLVFGLMSFNQVGPKMESSLGSSGLLALMVTMTVCTNLFFLAVCYLLFFLGEARAPFYSSGGVWNLLICLITVECMATPEQTRRFWIVPVDIPSKFYPLVLVFVFGLMRSTLLDLLCSAAVGYAYATGRMDRLKPSRSRLAGWESGCLSNFVNYSGYIVNGAARGPEAFGMPLNNPADHPSNQRGDDRGGESNSGFSLFRRGRAGTEEGQGGGGDGAGTGDGGGSGAGFGSKNVIKRGGRRRRKRLVRWFGADSRWRRGGDEDVLEPQQSSAPRPGDCPAGAFGGVGGKRRRRWGEGGGRRPRRGGNPSASP